MKLKTPAVLAVMTLMVACGTVPNSNVPVKGITALEVIERWDKKEIVVLDVRSDAERKLGGVFLKIQFGPDKWTGEVTPEESMAFVQNVRAHLKEVHKPVVVLCQHGVRSSVAWKVLESNGIHTISVLDGYLGNNQGPGWKAWTD